MNNSVSRTDSQAPLVSKVPESRAGGDAKNGVRKPEIPSYLENTYWWAYINPKAISFFEQHWVINLILGEILHVCGMLHWMNWAHTSKGTPSRLPAFMGIFQRNFHSVL